MANVFFLDIVTPMKELNLGEVSYLRAPGVDGLFGIMSGHRKSVFAVEVGEVKVVKDGEESFFATSQGYAEITGSSVQMLVETIERSEEIDVTRAKAAKTRAEKRLTGKDINVDRSKAESALIRAINRLQIGTRF